MELKVFNLVAFTKKKKKSFFGGPGYPLTGAVLTQANWTITATALVASVRQGDTNASAIQNITPPGVSASNRAYGQGGATTANAGAGITIAGANAGYTEDIKAITQGTAAAGAILTWENIVGAAAGGVETPFGVGRTCLVTVSLTNSVAARATGNISLGMFWL